MTHSCIKCGNSYEDTDPEPYYCPPCNELKKAIAKEIDEKFKTISKKPVKSDMQRYNEITQRTGNAFVKASDLGL